MTGPASDDVRIRTLEGKMATLEQRVSDNSARIAEIASDVKALAPLVISHAEMKVTLSHVERQLHDALLEVEGVRKYLEEREDRQAAERIAGRRWVVGTVIAATATIVGAMAFLIEVLGNAPQ